MTKKISIHSFRGGTGKTNMVANVGSLLASIGLKVGVIDTDIQSPGLHVLFGINDDSMGKTLNDFVWGRSDIAEAAHDVTSTLGDGVAGTLYLIPSSIKTSEVAKILRDDSYNPAKVADSFDLLISALGLDVLVIDTHPGLNDETLLSLAVSDVVGLLLTPDHQSYQGTSVALEIAEKLDVPRVAMIVNKSPALFSADVVKNKIEQAYERDVVAVLPHSDLMLALSSKAVFSIQHPDDPLTTLFKQVAKNLMM